MVEFKRILAGADVALVGASQAEPFQMSDQRAVAATWLGKGADPVKVRNQRQYRRKWRGVEITLTSLDRLPTSCSYRF